MYKYFFCSIILLFLFSCTDNQNLTEQEVINTIKQFDQGWEFKRMGAVDSALSPSYVYFTQSGNIFCRDSVVATAGENNYLLRDMNRSEIEVTITGNTAIVSSRWKGEGTYRGSVFKEDQRCSLVLIKTNSRVRILSEHCTPIKAMRIFH